MQFLFRILFVLMLLPEADVCPHLKPLLGATNTRVGELIGNIYRTLFIASAILLESPIEEKNKLSVGVCRCLSVSVGVCRCLSVSVGVCRCLSVSVCKEFLPRNPT